MRKSGFLEGAIIATLAIFFTKFIGIVYVIPFYGIVGSQGGALYGYAYNIYNLFLIISSAGIPLAISKLASEYNALNKQKEKEYMFQITRKIILAFSIISFLICYIFAPQIASLIIGNVEGGNTPEAIATVIRCVSFAILIVPMLAISRGYLQGHGYIRPASFSQVIEQIVRVIVILGGSYFVLNILDLSLTTAVGVAVFGACAGAIAAYVYLINKMNKVKKDGIVDTKDLKKEERLEIAKKIVLYSIPFIITNIANSLYNSTDMILLIRGLDYLNFNAIDIETISSVFTTWGHKLNTIVTSIATGIAISLVPNIAKSYAKKDFEDINIKFNKTLQIFFYVAMPLAIFMSVFTKEIWQIFYGISSNDPISYYGPIIFRFSIITAAVDALYIMICNGLQGLNKSKLIYISVGLGLLINLCLDIPLMILFNSIGIYPYYGAIAATIIGYSISLIIPLVTLKKKYNLNYSSTTKKLPKLFGIYLIMILLSLGYRGIINNVNGRMIMIPLIGIIGIILVILYYFLNKKEIEEILGGNIIEIIKRKKRDK
ncbi:MAG: polysaccharide biosynthesis protein [Bacilli bacterium]|nr:polysaccharide biosynthesis protein [Bacilli bacterium]